MKKLDKKNIDNIYALTPVQEGMLYHYLRDPESEQYFEQLSIELYGGINYQLFEQAWNAVIEDNEALRTVFRWEKLKNNIQIVLKENCFTMRFHDFTSIADDQIHSCLETVLKQDCREKFDLQEIPFRVTLCKLDEAKHIMIISSHHILFDGWSNGIILKELFSAYSSLVHENKLVKIPKSKFEEFVSWLKVQNIDDHMIFWKNYLKGFDLCTQLPVKKSVRSEIKRADVYKITFDEIKKKELDMFVKEHKITLAAFLYSIWGILLQKYSNTDDVIFGITVSGRNADIKGIEHIVGLFINTIPLRIKTNYDEKIIDLLVRINKEVIINREYETTSLVKIKECSELSSKEELFDTIVVIEQYPIDNAIMDNDTLSIKAYSMKEMNNYDLTVTVILSDTINIDFVYNAELFDQDTMARLAHHFSSILEDVINNPYKLTSDVNAFWQGEKNKVISDFNNTNLAYQEKLSIQGLFKKQVCKLPDNIAIISGEDKITYHELDKRAMQVAQQLKESGIRPESVIAIALEQTIDIIVTVLGILKAGCVYLLLDTTIPANRIRYMLADSGTKLLLTTESFSKTIDSSIRMIYVNDKVISNSSLESEEDYEVINEGIAYMGYSSADANNPKSFLVKQSSIINITNWAQNAYSIDENDVVMGRISFSFDTSLWELFWCLFQGATFCAPKTYLEKELEDIFNQIEKNNITSMHLTPAILKSFLDYVEDEIGTEGISGLRQVFVSGDNINSQLLKRFNEVLQDNEKVRIVGLYGYEECAGCVSYFDYSDNCDFDHIYIGKPISNIGLYVVDRNNNLQPIGCAGELMVAKDGLGSEYLNSKMYKCGKLIQNPSKSSDKIYRTSDIVKWLPNGNIVFLRNNSCVMINGYRIKINDIETCINSFSGIKEAVVIVKEDDSDKYICSYFVSDNEIPISKLRKYLSYKLPQYMIPSYFVQIKSMPRKFDGEIDRRAFLGSARTGAALEYSLVLPKNETERVISQIWKEVLNINEVGIHNNFFDIGGNSLNILQVNSELTKVFDSHISLATMFRYPTISALAQYIEQMNSNAEANDDEFNNERNIENNKSNDDQKQSLFVNDIEDIGNEVAIIGIGVRFPGTEDLDEFWSNLKNGIESISFYSNEELEKLGVKQETINNPNYVKTSGSVLKNVEYFDADFFGYSPREAETMDPQMRILHECVWEALENAGYNPYSFEGSIGLYAGATNNYYWSNLLTNVNANPLELYNAMILSGNDYLCTRISYKLNLKGPSYTLQTACSTSLVAISTACDALINNNCDMAVAGGVSVQPLKKPGYIYEDGMIFSPDGHCRAFDENAKGIVPGEGGAVVVLKQLKNAILDGDNIYAVIKGAAVNNDGIRKVGFTAPSVDGQVDVIKAAHSKAKINPESISYIEAHGTGTALGDPVEIEALRLAFNTDKKGFCGIGSIKTNMGHLDVAAGVAGLIKTVLSLKYKQIPPSLHFNKPNSKIDFDNSPFYVNNKLVSWKNEQYPLRAGVSSFGIGGTNAHIVLEEAPEQDRNDEGREIKLILLSAKTETALNNMEERLANKLRLNPDINLNDLAFTLQVGRRPFNYRRMIVVSNINELIDNLLSKESQKLQTALVTDLKRPVIFMFSGQGSQYVNMGFDLYRDEKSFRDEVDKCFAIIEPMLDYNIKDILYPEGNFSDHRINQTDVAQLLIFIFEYSLARLLMKWGIEPYGMIGHSIGEYVAACIAGVFSLEDALRIVFIRGSLMKTMDQGAMLSIELSEEQVTGLLDERLSLASVNSSSFCVISGSCSDIDEFRRQMIAVGHKCTYLHTSHAFHSEMMSPILNDFVEGIKSIKLNKPQIPYISNVSGTWITDEEATDSIYWMKHIRNTVRFSDGLDVLFNKTNAVFVEIGGGNALSTFARRHASRKNEHDIINMVRHSKENISDTYHIYSKLGLLWLYGCSIDWVRFNFGQKRYRIPLPTYPFERKAYWPIDNNLKKAEQNEVKSLNNNEKNKDLAKWFYLPLWEPSIPSNKIVGNRKNKTQWLLFIDECGVGNEIKERIRNIGDNVVAIYAGKDFCKCNDNEYTINTNNAADYELLFNSLKLSGFTPQKIIHMWGIRRKNDDHITVESLKYAQDYGFYSLMYIAQSMGRQSITGKLDMVVVTNNMQSVTGEEDIHPENATILGFIKVCPLEYPNINCRSVDIMIYDSESNKSKKLIDGLCGELLNDYEDKIVAYRGNLRWTQTYKSVELEESSINDKLKNNGVYLITGGLGGFGFSFAKYIANHYNAKIILLGRSIFPSRDEWKQWIDNHTDDDKIARIIQDIYIMEESGSEIIVESADVSNYHQIVNVIDRVEEKFGKINGLIHTAGVPDYAGIIQNRNKENTDMVLAPKVEGTIILDEILRSHELDFYVLCSSLSNVAFHHKFAQVGYIAANEFLDAFASYKTAKDNTFTVSINWPDWNEAGMSVEAAKKWERTLGADSQIILKNAISNAEGNEVLRRVLNNPFSRVVVSPEDLISNIKYGVLNFQQALDRGNANKTTHKRPELPVTFFAPQNNIEQKIADIWKQLLGIDQVGIYDNFFDLGASSLDAIQARSKINELLNTNLSIVTMYSYPTISSLSKYLSEDKNDDKLSSEENTKIDDLNKTSALIKRTIFKMGGSQND